MVRGISVVRVIVRLSRLGLGLELSYSDKA